MPFCETEPILAWNGFVCAKTLACIQLSKPLAAEFVKVKTTVKKLDFAHDNGAEVPELHYLLAGLYNSALHASTDSDDFMTPVINKLKNNCIRGMVRQALK